MGIIDVLKILADENRLRIINLLHKRGKLCVCDIEDVLGLTQSNASRHLTRLKKEKIITAEKRAQWVDYSINEEFLEIHPFVGELLERELNGAVFKEDLDKSSNCIKSCK